MRLLRTVGVSIYYKASGGAEAFEFAPPAEILHEGRDLLQLPFDQLIGLLQQRDQNIEVETDGLTAHGLGVGAYAPFAEEEPTAKPESIIVFEKGYYG